MLPLQQKLASFVEALFKWEHVFTNDLIFGTPYLSYSAKRQIGKMPTAIGLKRSFAYTALASSMLNCFNKSHSYKKFS